MRVIQAPVPLKPCPFCGNTDIELLYAVEYWCLCTNCHASNGTSSFVDTAAKKWNQRTEQLQLPIDISIQGKTRPEEMKNV